MMTGHLSYFWAPWCTRCATVSPVVTSVAETNHLRVEMIDVEAHPGEAQDRRVFGVPTVIATAPDGTTYRRSGTLSKAELQQLADFAKGQSANRPLLDSDEMLRLAAGVALVAIGAVTSTIGLTLLGIVLALTSVANRLRRNRDPAP
jgi:thioredoxin-like negative regulator of GroEL